MSITRLEPQKNQGRRATHDSTRILRLRNYASVGPLLIYHGCMHFSASPTRSHLPRQNTEYSHIGDIGRISGFLYQKPDSHCLPLPYPLYLQNDGAWPFTFSYRMNRDIGKSFRAACSVYVHYYDVSDSLYFALILLSQSWNLPLTFTAMALINQGYLFRLSTLHAPVLLMLGVSPQNV